MSNALAIASVTHVLKDLLNNGLIDQNVSGATGNNVNVTSLPPDRIDVSSAGQSQLNLFMYRVTPNIGWSNMGMPTYNSKGEKVGNQPLALNLHYLLTAYASTDLHTEILLGYGMQLLHETPFLDRDAIQFSLSPASATAGGGLPDDLRALSTSNLAQQPELIKIIPENINTEEISKLWAAFQAKYRPTAAYTASVVLIESDLTTKPSMPVGSPTLVSFPFKSIVIDELRSRETPGSAEQSSLKVPAGHQIIIKGKNLYAKIAKVSLNGTELSGLDSVEEDKIIFTVPSNLRAGIQSVQVSHYDTLDGGGKTIKTSESNIEPFVLCPSISNITASNIQGSGNAPRSAEIQIDFSPGVESNQKVVLLLNEYNPGASADELHAYTFNAPSQLVASPPGSATGSITFTVKNVFAATYIVRVRVDGSESLLGNRDANGYYHEPNVVIS